jgi:hypothetical protein
VFELLWIDESVGTVEFSLENVEEIDECSFYQLLAVFLLHGICIAFCDIAAPLLEINLGSSVEVGSRTSSSPHSLVVFRPREEKHDGKLERLQVG